MKKNSIIVLSASSRAQSQSTKVARFLMARLELLFENSVYLVDLAKYSLPFWEEQLWLEEKPQQWNQSWGEISDMLNESAGIIIVTPEWGGMAPAVLKNFFLLCGAKDLAHKPGLIVSISAGNSGYYPVSELRMSSYKNTHICYIPTHLVISNVESLLNEPDASSEGHEKSLRERIDMTLDVFMAYVKGLSGVREAVVHYVDKYPYGM